MDDEEDLECPVCTEVYNHDSRAPMMMPCLHSICVSCVADLVSFASPGQKEERLGQGEGQEPQIPRSRVVRCPLCRDDFNTDRLQTNRYILAHLRDLARLEALQAMRRWGELGQEPHTAAGQPHSTPPPPVPLLQVPPPITSHAPAPPPPSPALPEHRGLSRRKAFVRLRRPEQPPPPVPTQPPPASDPQQPPPASDPQQPPLTPNIQQAPPTPIPRQAPPTPIPRQAIPTPSPRQAPPSPNPQQPPPPSNPQQPPPPSNLQQPPPPSNPQQPPPACNPQQAPPPSNPHQSLSASNPLHPSPASTSQQPLPSPNPQRPSTPPKSKQAPPPPSRLRQEPSNQLTPPGRLYPTLEGLPDTLTSPHLLPRPPSAAPPSNKGLPSASDVCSTSPPPSAPSAPPSRDVLDNMWCRTCEEPARGNTCAAHHLTPLLKEEEVTWIEQRQQRGKQRRKQEKQQMKQQRKQQKQQQQQERKDWKLAVKLANTSLKTAEETSLPRPDLSRTAGVDTADGSGRPEETVGGSGRPEDLGKWSYEQILHAINTSCDLEFLQVCHREFDRRRQEYRRTIRRGKGHRGRPKIVP